MKQVQDKLNHNLKRGWCLHQMSKCRLEAWQHKFFREVSHHERLISNLNSFLFIVT
jgi:hypothetical protein